MVIFNGGFVPLKLLPRAHYEFGVKKAGLVRVRWHCAYVGTGLGGHFQWWFRSVEAYFDSRYHSGRGHYSSCAFDRDSFALGA